jgi:hypothetical protein
MILASINTRDFRIDAIRGLSLLVIFTNHLSVISGNLFLRSWSLVSITLCDFANVFIFISGYVAGMVYSKILIRDGFKMLFQRTIKRAAQLYYWHFVALIISVLSILVLQYYGIELIKTARLNFLFSNPLQALPATLGLAYAPYAFDVLRLYILLLLVLPLWLKLLDINKWLAVAVSLIVYLIPQFVGGANISEIPAGKLWYFNPLAWQLQFFLGSFLAVNGLPGSRDFWRSKSITSLALTIVIAGILVRTMGPYLIETFNPAVPFIHDDLLYGKLPLTGKMNLEPVRLIYFSALLLLTVNILPKGWSFWKSDIAKPFVLCGKHALQIYSTGLILVFVSGHILRNINASNTVMIIATIIGISIQVTVANHLEQRKIQSRSQAPH